MRIAFLSDIHSNLPALDAALAKAEEMGAERIVVAGDIVGSGPFPLETIERLKGLRQLDAIRGNVDRKVLKFTKKKKKKLKKRVTRGKKSATRAWTALQLPFEAREWLASLPTMLPLAVEDRVILVVHGSPNGDTDYVYPSLTVDGLRNKLKGYHGDTPAMMVSGHSHVPFAKPVDQTMVVNCGSVGRPADGDPRGSFAFVEIEPGFPPRAQIVRFCYPIEEVAEALERRSVPRISPDEYRMGVKS